MCPARSSLLHGKKLLLVEADSLVANSQIKTNRICSCSQKNIFLLGRFLTLSFLFFQVKGPGIGLLGISLGADICLSMASFLKNVSATVSINGSGFSGNKSIYYKETCIPPLGHDLRRIKIDFSGLLDIVDIRNDIVGGHENLSVIPIEKAQGPILFIVGQDDHNWRSELYAQIASERLQAHGKEKPQIISYPGTGHYIEPPYFPWCPASLHKLLKQPVIWGGEPRSHSKAQVDAWKQILTFFYTHLGGTWKGASPKL